MIIVIRHNNGYKSSISTNLSKKDAQILAKRIAKTNDVKQVSVDDFVVAKVKFNLPSKFTIKNLLKERNSILSRKGIKNVI